MKKRTLFFKKLNRVLAAALLVPALTFFVACSDDDKDATDPNTIANMPGSLALAAEGSPVTANLAFVANSAWEASSTDDWFEFTPKSGQAGNVTITVTTTYNLGATKTGTLTIKHGTKTYDVKISQNGKPDVAVWEPEGLGQVEFAPDPYNATEEMPASFEIVVKTNNDYKTLEEAPYQIMTFAVDEAYNPIQDQKIDWVEFKIADNSPVASEGKKIVVSVKPHEEFRAGNKPNLFFMDNRYAYITIVPKGTEVADMFDKGVIKEEYEGTAIQQNAYKLSHSADMKSLGVGMPFLTSVLNVTSKNFKTFEVAFYAFDADPDSRVPLDWFHAAIDGDQITLDADSGHFNSQVKMFFNAYRGTELTPLELKHLKPMTVMCMKQ